MALGIEEQPGWNLIYMNIYTQSKRYFGLIITLLAPSVAGPVSAADSPGAPYLAVTQKFADTLLDRGLDIYGPRKTAIWCGVIHVDTYLIPQKANEVPAPPGVRGSDRSVGGCNMYQDVSTMRAFRTLSKVSGIPKYEKAVIDYARDYLAVAQDPVTGMLAWGEHLYYNVHEDRVGGRAFHEMLEWTPPLDLLWEANPEATAREIAALKYHFLGEEPDASGWIFNRHSDFGKPQYQLPESSQPWIKHSSLYAYAYKFLYSRTKEKQWLDRSLGIGTLYWNHRNPATDLTVGCIGDKRPFAQNAEMISAAHSNYWLLKASQLEPGTPMLREQAVAMFKAYDRYAWDPKSKRYCAAVKTDGTKIKAKPADPWKFSYGGGGSLIPYGRVAAYFARTEKDPVFRDALIRVVTVANNSPLPEVFTPQEIGFGIHLNLDAYELTEDKIYLQEADRLGKVALSKLWAGGLFRRTPGDSYYEAKVGPGDLVSALLRLSLRLDSKPDPAGSDWSF